MKLNDIKKSELEDEKILEPNNISVSIYDYRIKNYRQWKKYKYSLNRLFISWGKTYSSEEFFYEYSSNLLIDLKRILSLMQDKSIYLRKIY